ncbi:MAG: hypothetical protein Q8N26_33810 [Myxococcales bacterium]|nr:hypothetical protein [Myxococcales bacterium]
MPRTMTSFVGQRTVGDGVREYVWNTTGAALTVRLSLSPAADLVTRRLPQEGVEVVLHDIAKFLATALDEDGPIEGVVTLHFKDSVEGRVVFQQLLEKLMSAEVLSRTALAAIVEANPSLGDIHRSFADLWFDRDGEFL